MDTLDGAPTAVHKDVPHGDKGLAALAARYPDRIAGYYRDPDGIWVDLKAGWSRWGEVHAVHEATTREIKAAMAEVVPCSCADCKVASLPGPSEAEAQAVAALIGHPPENAPPEVRKGRYDDIDLHGKATAWPQGPLPKLTGEEAIRAAKRLWRNAVGLAWPGTWKSGRGNHRSYPRGSVFLVNPGQGWDGMVHDLSHQAYKYLTRSRRRDYPLSHGKTTRSPTITAGKPAHQMPICSDAKIRDYETVRSHDTAGRRRHHTEPHAQLERAMIRMVIDEGWLDGRLRPPPPAPKVKAEPKPKPPKPDPVIAEHENVLARLKAWRTKAKRAATAIKKLEKDEKRLRRRRERTVRFSLTD